MKTFFLFAGIFLLASCSQYQYVTLNSEVRLTRDRGFLWENDTVSVQYFFSGRNCPVTINVYNKLSQPLYVYWNNSAVVFRDGTRLRLWNDNVEIKSKQKVGKRIKEVKTKVTKGTREAVSVIPPMGHVSERPISLTSAFVMPLLLKFKEHIPEGDSDNAKAEKFNYKRDESPFIFRFMLSLSTADVSRPIHLDHLFWASNIVLTMLNSSSVPEADNRFYVSRKNIFGRPTNHVGSAAFIAKPVYLTGAADADAAK